MFLSNNTSSSLLINKLWRPQFIYIYTSTICISLYILLHYIYTHWTLNLVWCNPTQQISHNVPLLGIWFRVYIYEGRTARVALHILLETITLITRWQIFQWEDIGRILQNRTLWTDLNHYDIIALQLVCRKGPTTIFQSIGAGVWHQIESLFRRSSINGNLTSVCVTESLLTEVTVHLSAASSRAEADMWFICRNIDCFLNTNHRQQINKTLARALCISL